MLFSSRNAKTVQRHFRWMAEHGVDGAFLQRFLGQCDPASRGLRQLRDEVGDRVREAAEKEGRVFAIMYDVTGVPAERVQHLLIQDWVHLTRTKRVLDSPNYLKENGRPVVALWGLGFENAGHTPAMVRAITQFFRSSTIGGAYLMAGTPTHWRTAQGDCERNPEFTKVFLEEFDAISPWTIGRYKTEQENDSFAESVMKPDFERIQSHNQSPYAHASRKVDYIPVVFPGGSGHNLSEGKWGLNDAPRMGGRFLWKQVFNAHRIGARIIYGAMWDEYDEGTAFMPAITHKHRLPVSDRWQFMALDQDGHDLPADWYMRICGFAAEVLRGERRLFETFPSKELHDYWASRPKYEDGGIAGPSAGSSSSTAPPTHAAIAGSAAPTGVGIAPGASGISSVQQGAGQAQSYEEWVKSQKSEEPEAPPPAYSLEAEPEEPNRGPVSPSPAVAASITSHAGGGSAVSAATVTSVNSPAPIQSGTPLGPTPNSHVSHSAHSDRPPYPNTNPSPNAPATTVQGYPPQNQGHYNPGYGGPPPVNTAAPAPADPMANLAHDFGRVGLGATQAPPGGVAPYQSNNPTGPSLSSYNPAVPPGGPTFTGYPPAQGSNDYVRPGLGAPQQAPAGGASYQTSNPTASPSSYSAGLPPAGAPTAGHSSAQTPAPPPVHPAHPSAQYGRLSSRPSVSSGTRPPYSRPQSAQSNTPSQSGGYNQYGGPPSRLPTGSGIPPAVNPYGRPLSSQSNTPTQANLPPNQYTPNQPTAASWGQPQWPPADWQAGSNASAPLGPNAPAGANLARPPSLTASNVHQPTKTSTLSYSSSLHGRPHSAVNPNPAPNPAEALNNASAAPPIPYNPSAYGGNTPYGQSYPQNAMPMASSGYGQQSSSYVPSGASHFPDPKPQSQSSVDNYNPPYAVYQPSGPSYPNDSQYQSSWPGGPQASHHTSSPPISPGSMQSTFPGSSSMTGYGHQNTSSYPGGPAYPYAPTGDGGPQTGGGGYNMPPPFVPSTAGGPSPPPGPPAGYNQDAQYPSQYGGMGMPSSGSSSAYQPPGAASFPAATHPGADAPAGNQSQGMMPQAQPVWVAPGGNGPPPPSLPPRPSSNYTMGSSSSSSYGGSSGSSGVAFPAVAAVGSSALGMAWSAVGKVAGKKTQSQLESQVGSLAHSGSKLFSKFTK